jgi:hypothetical protein
MTSSTFIPRYVPELQALAARALAKFCRALSPSDRVGWLLSLPPNARELVECFPTNFVVWCGHEQLLWTKVLRFYLNDPVRRERNINKGYEKDCERGITRRKVLWRKCCNIYCKNESLQKIISSPDEMYWRMCSECEKFRMQHHVLMKLKTEIEDFEF